MIEAKSGNGRFVHKLWHVLIQRVPDSFNIFMPLHRVLDITLPINNKLPVWPGDLGILVEPSARIVDGAPANLSRIEMGSHTGTHIDAPFHFVLNGRTVDKIPLALLMGKARVIEVPDGKQAIDSTIVESIDPGLERVLFKTQNSKRYSSKFIQDFVALTPNGASALVEKGAKLVGIDYLSIETYGSKEHETHHILLRSGVVIIEGLSLKNIEPGDYELIALPLKIEGGDGAPARVVLRSL
ncbi:MAG TPA: cyclase family protein [Candidatus Tripitaka californicus]|uniref:cyclase family protein n=1 Tax=Candidatus Tripitaka californicus TaxID=3367616 RepID=UPI00402A5B68|nr:cyclase family protein [Planctomycetota bacterium]